MSALIPLGLQKNSTGRQNILACTLVFQTIDVKYQMALKEIKKAYTFLATPSTFEIG